MKVPAPEKGILTRSLDKWTVKGQPHITVWTIGPTRGWEAKNSQTGAVLHGVNRRHLIDQIKESWLGVPA